MLAAVRRLTDRPIRYVINTSADDDHVGGNDKLSKAGQTILGHPGSSGVSEDVYTSGGAASVLAHENVFTRMSAPQSPFPFAVRPTKTYTGRSYPMYLNGDGIQVVHMPAAHSDGDSIVFFRRCRCDRERRHPRYDLLSRDRCGQGRQHPGEIDALNRLLDDDDPAVSSEVAGRPNYVIPGHGFVADYGDVVEYRNVVTIVRDRIEDMAGKGMTLEQVKAADPTKGFRARYGSDTGVWTTERFIEAVYQRVESQQMMYRLATAALVVLFVSMPTLDAHAQARDRMPPPALGRVLPSTSPVTGCRSSRRTGDGAW